MELPNAHQQPGNDSGGSNGGPQPARPLPFSAIYAGREPACTPGCLAGCRCCVGGLPLSPVPRGGPLPGLTAHRASPCLQWGTIRRRTCVGPTPRARPGCRCSSHRRGWPGPTAAATPRRQAPRWHSLPAAAYAASHTTLPVCMCEPSGVGDGPVPCQAWPGHHPPAVTAADQRTCLAASCAPALLLVLRRWWSTTWRRRWMRRCTARGTPGGTPCASMRIVSLSTQQPSNRPVQFSVQFSQAESPRHAPFTCQPCLWHDCPHLLSARRSSCTHPRPL